MIRDFAIVRVLAVISLCLALLGAACKRHSDDGTDPFPVSNEVVGWTRIGDIRTFQAGDLWKYIDGEAERYLNAGVQTASTADYRFGNKLDAVADVYTMGVVAGAEKIFESEPSVGAEGASLGDGAHLYGQSLVFRKGRYLVRITAYEDSVELRGALLALAHGIERSLPR